jgi:alkyl hydroperoxide reductase subunit D
MIFGTNTAVNDPSVGLLKDLGMGEEQLSANLKFLSGTDSKYLRDLKINVNNALNTPSLQKKESFLVAIAVMVNEKNSALQDSFSKLAKAEGADDKEIAEVISCASLMAANNVYYRFRHFMQEEFYNNAQAGIRMSIMMNPVVGKELFELISLVISSINGCEMCVTSHEKNLIQHGTSKQRIHDSVRLGAVLRSLVVLF